MMARLHRPAVALCAAAWTLVGLLKVIDPTPLGIAGTRWSEGYAIGLGLAEIAIGVGMAVLPWRAMARIAALLVLTAFLLLWSKVDLDCGCLGAVQLDQAGRTVLIGILLTLHGAEMIAANGPALRPGVSHAS